MPETITGPDELLATLLGMAQMQRAADNTGRCGDAGEWCFQLFAPAMTVAATGSAAVDQALTALRDNLRSTWQAGSAAAVAAAKAAFPGRDWEIEWAFDGDAIQLICTQPSQ